MLGTNTVFCCHRNEIIARLKEDFGYETRLPLTGPIRFAVRIARDLDEVITKKTEVIAAHSRLHDIHLRLLY